MCTVWIFWRKGAVNNISLLFILYIAVTSQTQAVCWPEEASPQSGIPVGIDPFICYNAYIEYYRISQYRSWIKLDTAENMELRKSQLCPNNELTKDTLYLAFVGEQWGVHFKTES